jgi:methylated-DNA-[protein]-cysteine S-methyltransferase
MTMTSQDPDQNLADLHLTDLLGPPPADDVMAALHAKLTAQAEHSGLLDVAYRTLDTPVGTLLLAATPAGLVRVAYEREGIDAVLERLAGKVSPRILNAPHRLDGAARQIEEYFSGHRQRFDLSLDLALASGFRRSVLSYLPAIGYGHTASYQSVAAAVNNPRAVRADGQLGAYLGGPEIKHRLLDMEASA